MKHLRQSCVKADGIRRCFGFFPRILPDFLAHFPIQGLRWAFPAGLACFLVFILAIGAVSPLGAQPGPVSASSDGPASLTTEDAQQIPGAAPLQALDTEALTALILILENSALRQRFVKFIKQQGITAPNLETPAGKAGAGDAGAPGSVVAEPPDVPSSLAPASAPSAPLPSGPSVVNVAMEMVQGWLSKLLYFLNDAVDIGRLGGWLKVQASSAELSGFWIDFLTVAGAVLLAASAAYWGLSRALRRMRFATPQLGPRLLLTRLKFLAMQFAISVLAIGGFAVTAYVVSRLLPSPSTTDRVLFDVTAAVGLALALCSLVRALLCPRHPSFRLVAMRDDVARDLFQWLRRLILLVVLGRAFFENIDDLRVPSGVFEGLERLWGLAGIIYAMVLVLRYRSEITAWIVAESGRFKFIRSTIARIWLPVLTVYAIGFYLIWALDLPGASILVAQGTLLTLAVLLLVQPVAIALELWLVRAEQSDFGISSAVIVKRLRRYAWIAGRLAKAFVYIMAAIAIASAWELEPFVLLDEHLSGKTLDAITQLFTILVICLAVWEAFDLMLAVYMDATDDQTGKKIERSARTRTLVPLVRTILIAFLLIAFVAAALNSLGLDIAPLLATAGIVGIAIGFGAQKLVQDVITGLFMLFQDTLSVGDIVELGGISGTVQRITIRTIELRDLEGNLYTIPFSSVGTVKNMSREFAYALVDVGIAYRENADHVMEVLKQLGAELECDAVSGPSITGAIEVMGIHQLGDNAVVIRCRFKVLPQTQFAVRRAFQGLIKRRFDEMGIEIPFPQRTLHWAGPFERPSFSTETAPPPAAVTPEKS